MSAGQGNRIRSFTLVDPVSSTGCVARSATRLTGSTRVKAAFTLVELLIVIAILAVLAAAVVIVLNPAELLAQARDSQRITDLKTLKDSVDIFIVDNPSTSLGTAERVYISLPDTASNCPNLTASLPSLPTGWEYVCATTANLRNTDGTGWVPLDLGSIFGGTPIPYLPIDPSNDLATGRYYTYVMGGSYELTALMEATKENASVSDGGILPGVFEVGTHIGLTPPTRDKGLVGYWTFDEGSGTTAYDSSGRGNNGAILGSAVRLTGSSCKKGSCLDFDGINDQVSIPNSTSLNISKSFTLQTWVLVESLPLNTETNFIGKNGYAQYRIGIRKAGNLHGTFGSTSGTGTAYVDFDGNPIQYPSVGVWHNYAFSFDSYQKKVEIYVDGEQKGSTTISNNGVTQSISAVILGLHGTDFLSGVMDEVRIYDRALSAAEIKLVYDSTK